MIKDKNCNNSNKSHEIYIEKLKSCINEYPQITDETICNMLKKNKRDLKFFKLMQSYCGNVVYDVKNNNCRLIRKLLNELENIEKEKGI